MVRRSKREGKKRCQRREGREGEDIPGAAEKIVIFSNACISKTTLQNLTKFLQYIDILLDNMTVKCECSNTYDS